MLELLQTYSGTQIVVFMVLFCVAAKEAISFFDWARARMKEVYDKKTAARDEKEQIQDQIKELIKYFEEKDKRSKEEVDRMNASFDKANNQVDFLTQQMKLLLESDKDDIKSFITREHHYFCYQKGWIDDYSLDCIERRYEHYKREGGNSFIKELMDEIRALPKRPPSQT